MAVNVLATVMHRLHQRGGVQVEVDGTWYEVRVHLLRGVGGGEDLPVIALSDLELLLRAEKVR